MSRLLVFAYRVISYSTAYMFVAIQLQERDLMEAHPQYGEYKRRVPMILFVVRTTAARQPLILS
jgi:methanethiol S-methyltransferase